MDIEKSAFIGVKKIQFDGDATEIFVSIAKAFKSNAEGLDRLSQALTKGAVHIDQLLKIDPESQAIFDKHGEVED